MRSKLFLGLVLGGLSVGAFAGGCGGSDSETTGGAGGSGASSTSSTTSTATSMSTSSSGPTTGTGGNGNCAPMFDNHTFDTASPITLNDMSTTASCLPDPKTSKDYYKFTGTKGEKLGFFVFAKTAASMDGFDPSVVDVVVTLFDAQHNQVAFQDDPWPRNSNDPSLYTMLPADGDYYLLIQDCNAWQPMGCYDPANISIYDYQVAALDITGDAPENAEPNETNPAVVPYSKDTSGNYYLNALDGFFQSGTDEDVFSFTPPADVAMAAGARVHADFWLQTAGTDVGDGSTASIGRAWVTDIAGNVLGSIDGTKYGDVDNPMNGPADLSVPLLAADAAPDGTTAYLFHVQHPATAASTNDFYYAIHFVGTGGNKVETAETANDTPAGAEPLDQQANADGSYSYFTEGDLISATDVDHFLIDPAPSGVTTVSVFCAAARDGSGLTGFTFSLLDQNGAPIADATATEALDSDVFINAVAIPAGLTSATLKLSATGQDATNPSKYYRCGIAFSP